LVNFGNEYETRNREILQYLRERNVSCEFYPEPIKFDKQFKYANKKNIEYVIMIGEDELADHLISIKNFKTGEQSKIPLDELLTIVR
jgi:histidyl-tRNA synthetase